MSIEEFNSTLKFFYTEHKRNLSWREQIVPYHVVLTEIMLQQTQVPRVQQKFPEFISVFPNFKSLAEAPLSKLLAVWQGMGYNRRVKYLQEIATIIHEKYKDIVPQDPDLLDEMPGIGYATARSIVTYIYNIPEIFIETNVRRVFIHHFFEDQNAISDNRIYPLVEKAIDKKNPREWYYAVMDYGTFLAKNIPNPNRKSKHYTKQSKFEGSNRQIRGSILKSLLNKSQSREELAMDLGFEMDRVYSVLRELEKEGFVAEEKGEYRIK